MIRLGGRRSGLVYAPSAIMLKSIKIHMFIVIIKTIEDHGICLSHMRSRVQCVQINLKEGDGKERAATTN